MIKNLIMFPRSTEDSFNRSIASGGKPFNCKGYSVHVVYKENNYLRVSCTNEMVVNELESLGNKTMHMTKIAEYLMDVDGDDHSELLHTMEWHINPEIRQDELREGHNLGYRIVNLRLYSPFDMDTYEKGHTKKLKMGA